MKEFKINEKAKLYIIGNFNSVELENIDVILNKLKSLDTAISLVIIKDGFKKEDELNSCFDELKSIPNDEIRNIINCKEDKLSSTINIAIYKNIYQYFIDVTSSDKPEKEYDILNLFYNPLYSYSVIYENGLYNIYNRYCKNVLFIKYNLDCSIIYSNKNFVYNIINDIDESKYTKIGTTLISSANEENFDIFIYNPSKDNVDYYLDEMDKWASELRKMDINVDYTKLYLFTITKDNIDYVIDEIVLCMNYKETTDVIGVVTDLTKDELSKYKNILKFVRIHKNIMSLLIDTTFGRF